MTALANAGQDARPDLRTRRIRPYEGFDRSVAAVAAIPDERLGKMGMPVSCPFVVNSCGYEPE